jgi:hypothetical protein
MKGHASEKISTSLKYRTLWTIVPLNNQFITNSPSNKDNITRKILIADKSDNKRFHIFHQSFDMNLRSKFKFN